MANWAEAGFPCTAERHFRLQDNFSFAEVPEATVAEMIRDVAREGCDAVAVVCTNMRGAALIEALEDEVGVPIYDSIAVTVWKSLAVAGFDPARLDEAVSGFELVRSTLMRLTLHLVHAGDHQPNGPLGGGVQAGMHGTTGRRERQVDVHARAVDTNGVDQPKVDQALA